jgi:hypothetical protein
VATLTHASLLMVALLLALIGNLNTMPTTARQAPAIALGPDAGRPVGGFSAGRNAGDLEHVALAQASPRPATPRAATTPATGGCGNAASNPTEIAEVFLAAAMAEDLERAARCFAPESQPRDWDEVFLGGDEEAWDDVTGCRGLPYVVRASEVRSGVSAIIFTFDEACAVARLDSWQRQLYDADSIDVSTVVVQTYRADGRWWVWDAFALVTD